MAPSHEESDHSESQGSDSESDEEEYESDNGDDEEDTGGVDPVTLLTSPDFPRLAFVRACWESDSMMNRRRLWGQVRRFRVLWKDYRTNGWQKDEFYPASEIDAEEE